MGRISLTEPRNAQSMGGTRSSTTTVGRSATEVQPPAEVRDPIGENVGGRLARDEDLTQLNRLGDGETDDRHGAGRPDERR